jgi:hypothetical protein
MNGREGQAKTSSNSGDDCVRALEFISPASIVVIIFFLLFRDTTSSHCHSLIWTDPVPS